VSVVAGNDGGFWKPEAAMATCWGAQNNGQLWSIVSCERVLFGSVSMTVGKAKVCLDAAAALLVAEIYSIDIDDNQDFSKFTKLWYYNIDVRRLSKQKSGSRWETINLDDLVITTFKTNISCVPLEELETFDQWWRTTETGENISKCTSRPFRARHINKAVFLLSDADNTKNA
jgi:hypothetical protein